MGLKIEPNLMERGGRICWSIRWLMTLSPVLDLFSFCLLRLLLGSYVGEGNDGLGNGSGYFLFRSQDGVRTMYSNNSIVSHIFSN